MGMNTAEIGSVLAQYSIGKEHNLRLLNAGTANVNYTVECGGNRYVLRQRSARYSAEAWLRYEEEFVAHLHSRGLPVPVPVRNSAGNGWTVHRGKTYQMHPFLDGEPYEDSEAGVATIAVLLGEFHNAARDFQPSVSKPLGRYDNPAVALPRIDEAMSAMGSVIMPEEAGILAYVKRKAAEVLQTVPDALYRRLPQLAVHGDFHPANVKCANGAVSGLFDFDWVSLQPRLRDLADGLIFFAGRRSQPFVGHDIYSLQQGVRLEWERCSRFVRTYLQCCGLALRPEEMRLLPSFMAARLIFGRVQALAKIPPDRHIGMLTNDIAPQLRWLEEHADRFVELCQ